MCSSKIQRRPQHDKVMVKHLSTVNVQAGALKKKEERKEKQARFVDENDFEAAEWNQQRPYDKSRSRVTFSCARRLASSQHGATPVIFWGGFFAAGEETLEKGKTDSAVFSCFGTIKR